MVVYNFITDNSCLSLLPIFSASQVSCFYVCFWNHGKRLCLQGVELWECGLLMFSHQKCQAVFCPQFCPSWSWVLDWLHSIPVNESNLFVKLCFNVLVVKLAFFFWVNTLWAIYTKSLCMQKRTQLWPYVQTNDWANWLSWHKCCSG